MNRHGEVTMPRQLSSQRSKKELSTRRTASNGVQTSNHPVKSNTALPEPEAPAFMPREEVTEKRPKKQCGICRKALTTTEIEESNRFIGGGRYFCEKHLNQKMDW